LPDEPGITYPPNNQPWYIQYFGYSPSSPKPPGYQQAQYATVALKYPQPPGVEHLWMSVPGTYSATLDAWPPGWPEPVVIDLRAEEAFEGREARCLFFADVELQDGFASGGSAQTYPAGWFYGEGEDDTEQSKYEGGTKDSVNMVSKITAAEPGELTRIENFAYDPSEDPYRRCGRKVLCQLKDTAGRLMPGVLCQERFPQPSQMPPNVRTNTEDEAWFTRTASGVAPPNGNWDRYDELRYVWPFPMETYPPYAFPQQYWVATKSLTQGGILKKSWTITLTPGTPGTLNQDES
jgi:hypothetical protein